jgi:hypothetical protein
MRANEVIQTTRCLLTYVLTYLYKQQCTTPSRFEIRNHPLLVSPFPDTHDPHSPQQAQRQQRQRLHRWACLQFPHRLCLQALHSQSPSPTRPSFNIAGPQTVQSNGSHVQTLKLLGSVHYSRMSSTLTLFKSMCRSRDNNSVPLDYAKPAAGTAQIAMIRYPARTLPRRGSMFMNPGSHLRDPCSHGPPLILDFPGGPGASGVDWMTIGAPYFQSMVGEDWDVLSFDPREFHPPINHLSYAHVFRHAGGVGLSGPVLKQFASENDETNFWSNVMKPGAYEGHGNLTTSKDVKFLWVYYLSRSSAYTSAAFRRPTSWTIASKRSTNSS